MNIGIFTDTYTPQINGVVISIETLAKGLRAKGLSDDPEAIGNLSIEDAYEMFFAFFCLLNLGLYCFYFIPAAVKNAGINVNM